MVNSIRQSTWNSYLVMKIEPIVFVDYVVHSIDLNN